MVLENTYFQHRNCCCDFLADILYSGVPPSSEAWTSQVQWLKADCNNVDEMAGILSGFDAVVHTVGTLLETNVYRAAVRPLSVSTKYDFGKESYETINRLWHLYTPCNAH